MKEKFHKTSRSLKILGPQLCAIFSFAVNAFTNKSKFRKQLLLAEKHFIFLKKHPRSNLKVKQIIYDMISFYFELSGAFPIVKNNCLQHYVNVFDEKNIY